MSWLNFNDSLNSIKGQISTFANNVLAEEEGQENKELQELCQQQQLEIKKLKEFIEDFKSRQTNHQDGSNGSWNWDGEETGSKTSAEPVSALKKNIALLETEKAELLAQLEQLDADNQQNLVVINDKYQKVKEENKNLTSEIEKLKDKEDKTNPDNNLAHINQKLNHELDELKKELFVVKSSNESFQKIVEETKRGGGDGTSENYKKLERENKLLYAELKKANEQITFFEKKSLEDEDNCQKLAFILETYEKQVSSLKKELEDISGKYDEAQNQQQKEIQKMKNENDHQRYATDLKTLQEQLNGLKEHSSPEEIERFNREIWESFKLNEDLLTKVNGRIDTDLDGFEHDQNYESELNVLREKLERLKSYTDRGTSSSEEMNDFKLINKELFENEVQQDLLKEEVQRLQFQSEEDAKLIHMLRNQIEEIEQLKEEIGKLKTLNEDLLVKASGRMDMDLEDELENIQQEHEAQIEVLREELDQLRNQENKNIKDVEKFEELEEEKIELARELSGLQQQYEFLQESHKVSLHELHNRYINIITENIKKFQECEKPSDFERCVEEDDPQVAELSKHIENIIKILLDLKCKCSDLEKRILEISEEKNNILLEKNHEIEKLIQNSDMLSQEIVSKNQSIKEYENECNDIAKNNELLITELETYKSNPVLQTISESNEDSMILLEVQLENANKRIEDLEKVIDDLEKQQRKQSIESDNVDLENALEQLNKTEMEINTKTKDYEDLLNSFDQLQIHYESMKNELAENKDRLSYLTDENSNLRSALEKLKSEYESLEYQISEVNVNSESLKEETDEFKLKFKSLLSENSSLKLLNEDIAQKTLDYESNIDVLKEKLAVEEEQRKNLETQIETLTEKLKNFKMAETSFKLQCEQKNKELAAQSEARYNLEVALNKMNADLAEFQNNFVELQSQNDKILLEHEQLRDVSSKKDDKLKELEDLVKTLEDKTKNSFELIESPAENKDYNKLKQILDETVLEKANLHTELNKLAHVQSQFKEATDRCETLHKQLQEVTISRNELINMVTMKHQENVTYHNEIQRLNQVLAAEVEKHRNLEQQLKEATLEAVNKEKEDKNNEIEKLNDQNSFLKEKCEVLTKNLLEEQSKVQQLLAERSTPSEKEITLQKNLDRLQTHLIELEEHYTQELYQAEQKNQTLKARVGEIEERAKSSSTMYTSVSIRANQQVESLQSQLQTVVQERDSLRKQISDAEDQTTKQAAALANLQFVLEQFRKDKDQDVIKETERIRRHIQKEKQVQEELKVEISNLKTQLEERNQGLLAASRLSDQLESSKKTISGLKEEVSQLQTKLSRTEDELKDALSTTDGKVDKLLIKNLILGFVTSNNTINRDQSQILKIIATVLDFNQQDHDKVKLNKPQQGWLASFLAPHPENQNKLTEESLSRAFIKFLENESKPRVVPSLLNNSSTLFEPSSTKTTNSRSTTPGQTTPIVLSEIVLPTFSDFAQNRNSSSILKDVLKDNS